MAVRGCDGTDRWMNKVRGLMHKARISTSKTAAEQVGFGCPCHERRGHSEMMAGSVSPQETFDYLYASHKIMSCSLKTYSKIYSKTKLHATTLPLPPF